MNVATGTKNRGAAANMHRVFVLVALVAFLFTFAASIFPTSATAAENNSTLATTTVLAQELPSHLHEIACSVDPWECIPAYRWISNSDLFETNFNSGGFFSEIFQRMGMGIAAAVFTAAKVVWQLILWAFKFAFSYDWLSPDAYTIIDDNFARVAGWVTSTVGPAIFIIAVAMIIFGVSKKSVGGRGSKSWSDLIRVFVSFSLLFFMFWGAQQGGVGAPSWWLHQSQRITSSVSHLMTNAGLEWVTGRYEDYDGGRLGCSSFIDALGERLHDTTSIARTGGYNPATGSVVDRDTYHTVLAMEAAILPATLVSNVWEQTYLRQWSYAQFGDTRQGQRVGCYVQEWKNRYNPTQTQNLVNSYAGTNTDGYMFSDWGHTEHKAREIHALAACEVTGASSVSLQDEWKSVEFFSANEDSVEQYCESIFFGTSSEDDFEDAIKGDPAWLSATWSVVTGSSSDGDPFNFTRRNDMDKLDPVDNDLMTLRDAEELRNYIESAHGASLRSSTGAGLVSLIVAVVYLWAIGGLSIGAILAQFGAVITIVFFPAFLAMGMWPSEAMKGRFMKYMKMTIGMMFAKLVFTTLLTVLVLITTLFNELLTEVQVFGTVMVQSGLAGSGLGQVVIGGGWTYALPPIIAVFGMKWLFKQAGYGNPTSLMGGAKMVGNIAQNSQDMGSHSGGRAMSMMKYRMHPMSPYGPLSYRRLGRVIKNGPGSIGRKGQVKRQPDGGTSGPPNRSHDPGSKGGWLMGNNPTTAHARGVDGSGRRSRGDGSARGEVNAVDPDGRSQRSSSAATATAGASAQPRTKSKSEQDYDRMKQKIDATKAKGRAAAARANQFKDDLKDPATRKQMAKTAAKNTLLAPKRAHDWGWGKHKDSPSMGNKLYRAAAVGGTGAWLMGGGIATLPFVGVGAAAAGSTGISSALGTLGSLPTWAGGGVFSAMGGAAVPGAAGGALGGFQGVATGYGAWKSAKWAGKSPLPGAAYHAANQKFRGNGGSGGGGTPPEIGGGGPGSGVTPIRPPYVLFDPPGALPSGPDGGPGSSGPSVSPSRPPYVLFEPPAALPSGSDGGSGPSALPSGPVPLPPWHGSSPAPSGSGPAPLPSRAAGTTPSSSPTPVTPTVVQQVTQQQTAPAGQTVVQQVTQQPAPTTQADAGVPTFTQTAPVQHQTSGGAQQTMQQESTVRLSQQDIDRIGKKFGATLAMHAGMQALSQAGGAGGGSDPVAFRQLNRTMQDVERTLKQNNETMRSTTERQISSINNISMSKFSMSSHQGGSGQDSEMVRALMQTNQRLADATNATQDASRRTQEVANVTRTSQQQTRQSMDKLAASQQRAPQAGPSAQAAPTNPNQNRDVVQALNQMGNRLDNSTRATQDAVRSSQQQTRQSVERLASSQQRDAQVRPATSQAAPPSDQNREVVQALRKTNEELSKSARANQDAANAARNNQQQARQQPRASQPRQYGDRRQ